MKNQAYTLGQLIGMVELVEKGLVNPTHFVSCCIDIVKEYQTEDANHEAPYMAQAKRIADSYNAIAKREERPDLEQGDPIDRL